MKDGGGEKKKCLSDKPPCCCEDNDGGSHASKGSLHRSYGNCVSGVSVEWSLTPKVFKLLLVEDSRLSLTTNLRKLVDRVH